MPRSPRVLVDDGCYHVFARGNQRRDVFRDDEDRRWFLSRLRRVEMETGAMHIGHCLMDNHIHLVVSPGEPGLSLLMHRVLGPYAQWFNKRHGQVGHLFQDRFGSRVLESGEAVLWVLRYVHRNPVEAGLVRRAVQWRWSSLREHLDANPPEYLREGAKYVRSLLADDAGDAMADLLESTDAETGSTRFPAPRDGVGPGPRRPLGDRVRLESKERAERLLRTLLARTAELGGLQGSRGILGTSRNPRFSSARKEFCRRALAELRVPAMEVARLLDRSPEQVRRLARTASAKPR